MGSFGTDEFPYGNGWISMELDAPVKYASLVTDMPQLNNGKKRFHGVKISQGQNTRFLGV
jgi:hypothetical protein